MWQQSDVDGPKFIVPQIILFFRRPCYFADLWPRSDSKGPRRRLRPPDVPAAGWDQHRHVGSTPSSRTPPLPPPLRGLNC